MRTSPESLTATLSGVFLATAEEHADDVALVDLAGTLQVTWRQYADRTHRLRSGLAALGIRRGEPLALMLTNRPEAFLVDAAAMLLGAIPFSVYNTSAPRQVEYLLAHSGCRAVITEARFVHVVLAARASVPTLEHVFCVDGPAIGARDLVELERTADVPPEPVDVDAGVAPDDVVTIIYTSGTTGPPKAVELTHRSVLHNVRGLIELFSLRPGPRIISYLPMAHVADRVLVHYLAMVTGASVTFVEDTGRVMEAVARVHPTLFIGVPRLWEKLRAVTESLLHGEAGEQRDASFLGDLRVRLGLEAAETLLSGAAPIAPDVLEHLMALGLPIVEGLGMTECSGMVTCNRPGATRVGTVGQPMPGTEVACAPEDGELLVRGPTVMRRYRGDPEGTRQAVDPDGWLHTGDICEIDADGFVSIVGRKKELIINAWGKNMSPANIESKLTGSCSLIGHAMAIGDRRPFTTALIVLEPTAAARFAYEHGIPNGTLSSLAAARPILTEVEAGVRRANAQLSRVEQIKRFTVVGEEWQPGGDELTPTMKLRRAAIAAKHAATIDRMYAAETWHGVTPR